MSNKQNAAQQNAAALLSFLKVAGRPRFAMVCSQGAKPKPRFDVGPIDLKHSFAYQAPSPRRAKQVAKACRNLVRPLTCTNGSVQFIEEAAITRVRSLLLRFAELLGVKSLPQSAIMRIFGEVEGSVGARRTCDLMMQQRPILENQLSTSDPWLLYTVREKEAAERFKIGVSRRLELRTYALAARHPTVVKRFCEKDVAFCVEQGLHAVLAPFRDVRPRRAGVHGGDTEWYRPSAMRFLKPLSAFFAAHVRACRTVRELRECLFQTSALK